jgi:hypothetical protein
MIDENKENRNPGHALKSCVNDINQDGFGDKGDSDYQGGDGSTSWDSNSNDDGTTKDSVICRIHGCTRKKQCRTQGRCRRCRELNITSP